MDRLHRPVRRRRAGLRDPGRGRRADAAHLLPGPRARCRRAGATTTRSTAGRPTARRSSSARCATPTACRSEGRSTPCRCDGRPAEGAADADLGRRRLLARRQADRLLAALPRLPHLEALRGRLGAGPLRLRPRDEPTRSRSPSTPRTERDPMWIGDAIYFVSDRDGTLNLYSLRPRRPSAVAQLTTSTTWDVRWPSSDNAVAHRLRAGRRAARLRRPREGRPGARRSPCPTTASPCGPSRVSAPRSRSRTSSSARRASGRSSWPAATSSPRRSRRARRATSPTPRAPTTSCARWSPDGKQDRLRLRPQRRGRDLARRPGRRGKPEQLTTGGQAHALRPRVVGRRHAASPSPTRTASSSSSTLADKKLGPRSPTTSAGGSATTPGRRRAAYLAFSHDRPQRQRARSTSGARRTASSTG